jgi:hypothetical protein
MDLQTTRGPICSTDEVMLAPVRTTSLVAAAVHLGSRKKSAVACVLLLPSMLARFPSVLLVVLTCTAARGRPTHTHPLGETVCGHP